MLAQRLPGYEVREAQLRFADAVDEAIHRGANVLAELGTGTGKSFGYLVPVLAAGKKAIVTTTLKSLQEQLANKDLPFLQAHLAEALGKPIAFEYLKGKGNYVCDRRASKLQAQLGFDTKADADAYERFAKWYKATDTGDLDELNPPLPAAVRDAVDASDCDHEGCWAKRARVRAEAADVVVANHALTLLDAIVDAKTEGHARVLPAAPVLLMDEAHGLADVAGSVLGHEVSLNAWERLVARFRRLGGDKWAMDAQPAEAHLRVWSESLQQRMADARERQLVLSDERQFSVPLQEALRLYEGEARHRMPVFQEDDDKDAWLKGCDAVASFAESVGKVASLEPDTDPDAWVRFAEVKGGTARRPGGRPTSWVILQARPVDVAPHLRRMIWRRYATVVACSATLATPAPFGADTQFAFFREQVGVPADARVVEVVAPSPFPYERNSTLYVPPRGAITADKRRQPGPYHAQVALEIGRLLKASGGRAFCLFTSTNSMREVARLVAPTLPGHWRVFVQGEQSRGHIVEEFRDPDLMDSAPAVLFGTRTFFEGIDLPGRALELVILDALPFPAPSEPLYAARCRAIGRKTGDLKWGHFFPLTIPIVATILKQATGRLIRTATDKGVVAVLDRRLVEKGYGAGLQASLPPMPLTERFADVERVFPRPAPATPLA